MTGFRSYLPGEKIAILLTLCVLGLATDARAAGALVQDASQAADSSSSVQDASSVDAATSLPVSLDRIKRDLARAENGEGLRGLDQVPHFRVQIVEQAQNWVNPFAREDFSSPTVGGGGNYAYEMQQVMFPKTRYPLAQPYAAFNQGELLTVSITTLLQQLLTPKVVQSVEAAQRRHDEQAARDELARALAEYCAAQPNGGAGIFGCDKN